MKLLVAIAALALAGCSHTQRAAHHEQKGKQLFAKKDYASAVLEFKTAAQLTPRNPELWFQTGLTCLQLKDAACAAQAFRNATEVDPNRIDAQIQLAKLYAGSGQQEWLLDGEKRIGRVLDVSPGNALAWQTFAAIEIRLKKAKEAAGALETAARNLPGNVTVSVALAKARYASGDIAGAGQVLQQAAQGNPKSLEAALALAQFELATGSQDQAEIELRDALQIDAKNAGALVMLAASAQQRGRTAEAESLYRQLAAADPQYKAVYANFLLREGKLEAALAELERLARENPTDREIRGTLVATYIQLGRTAEAERIIESALKSNPHDADALLQRGELRLRAGQLADAERDLLEVIRFEPRSANAYYDLSVVEYRRANLTMQRDDLARALEINPNLIQARIALAQNFLASANPQSALDLMDAAPEAQKAALGSVVTRNSALLASGRRDEARKSIEQALRNSSAPELVLQKAQLDLQEGKPQNARNDMEKLIREHPKSVPARLVLAHAAEMAGDSRTEVQQYRSVLKLDKNNLEALNNLAYLLAREKSSDATVYAERALAVAPDRAPVLDTAAFAFYRNGMYRQAIENLEKAEATEPTPRRQYHLAIASLAIGDSEKGRSLLDTALKREPGLMNSERDWLIPISDGQ